MDDVRTSWGMFFSRKENSLVSSIEDRLARWVMVPADYGEGIQVLRYVTCTHIHTHTHNQSDWTHAHTVADMRRCAHT